MSGERKGRLKDYLVSPSLGGLNSKGGGKRSKVSLREVPEKSGKVIMCKNKGSGGGRSQG